MPTRKQKEAAKKGLLAEKRVARWLIDRGWTDVRYHRHQHAGPFDIDCKKGGESWLIEVKTGEKPSVKIANLVRMLETKRNGRIDKAALIFVPSNVKKPLLMFVLGKRNYVALKASIKRAGSEAAIKAWRTRRREKRHQLKHTMIAAFLASILCTRNHLRSILSGLSFDVDYRTVFFWRLPLISYGFRKFLDLLPTSSWALNLIGHVPER
jgi:Holliday junction resolvase-like predicted endonuclease